MSTAQLRTLHITNAFHENSGGIGTYYRALLAAAEKRSRELCLVVPGKHDRVDDVGRFTRVYRLAALRTPIFDRRYRLILPTAYLLGRKRSLLRIVQAERPDLIEVCDKYCLNWFAGLMRKGATERGYRPALVGLTEERMDKNLDTYIGLSHILQAFSRFYIRNLYLPMFDFHIANSAYTAEELFGVAGPGAEERIRIRPGGVDCSQFRPDRRTESARRDLLDRFKLQNEPRLLLYAGRLSPEKNLIALIDLMKYLFSDQDAEYQLIVAGDGPLAQWFQDRMSSEAYGRVSFVGHISRRDELADLYANCDTFVHPNPSEPFGIAPLEAMASGCPLVAPNSGGVLSYANKNNSWLSVPHGRDLAAAVRDVFSNTEIRNRKCAEALKTAREHDWDTTLSSLFEFYDSVFKQLSAELNCGKDFKWASRQWAMSPFRVLRSLLRE